MKKILFLLLLPILVASQSKITLNVRGAQGPAGIGGGTPFGLRNMIQIEKDGAFHGDTLFLRDSLGNTAFGFLHTDGSTFKTLLVDKFGRFDSQVGNTDTVLAFLRFYSDSVTGTNMIHQYGQINGGISNRGLFGETKIKFYQTGFVSAHQEDSTAISDICIFYNETDSQIICQHYTGAAGFIRDAGELRSLGLAGSWNLVQKGDGDSASNILSISGAGIVPYEFGGFNDGRFGVINMVDGESVYRECSNGMIAIPEFTALSFRRSNYYTASTDRGGIGFTDTVIFVDQEYGALLNYARHDTIDGSSFYREKILMNPDTGILLSVKDTSLNTGALNHIASLRIHGDSLVTINKSYSLPKSDGNTGYGMVTDGAGATSFQSVAVITSGTSAPATTPGKVGDIYVDTSAAKLYFAKGTASSADWVIAN